MKPSDGLLILALLIVALVVGCQKNRPASNGRSARRGAPGGSAATANTPSARVIKPIPHTSAPQAVPVTLVRATPTSAPSLGRARRDLSELAQGAEELRSALLHVEFEPVGPETSGKEVDNDPR